MTDRPILFSAPMVRAILAERKTQTRRILTPQPDDLIEGQVPRQLKIYIGDRLWVKESFYSLYGPQKHPAIAYAASNDALPKGAYAEGWTKKKLAIHMPRWASRITLIVEDVKVERLQDISAADVIAEGICPQSRDRQANGGGVRGWAWPGADGAGWSSPIIAYCKLWNSINGPGAWASNPWVVAYTFRPIFQNIDEAEAA